MSSRHARHPVCYAHARIPQITPARQPQNRRNLQLFEKLIMMRTKRYFALSTISSSSPGTKGGRMDSDMMQNGGTMGEEGSSRRGGRRKGGRKKGAGRKAAGGRKSAGGRKKSTGGRKKSTGGRKGGRKKSTGGRKSTRKAAAGRKGGRKSAGGRKGGRKKKA
jgi:hypothetical protein